MALWRISTNKEGSEGNKGGVSLPAVASSDFIGEGFFHMFAKPRMSEKELTLNGDVAKHGRVLVTNAPTISCLVIVMCCVGCFKLRMLYD